MPRNQQPPREKPQGREKRLQAIREAVEHPERLDDVTVDMVYCIIFNR